MEVRNSKLLYLGLLGLMIWLTVAPVHAAFNNASLKGSYSLLTNRWTVSGQAFGLVGVLKCDGAGNATLSYTAMSGGVENTGNVSGTYTVNSDGSGTITFTGGQNPPQYAIAIDSSKAGLAQGIEFVRVDNNYGSNSVEAGRAVLQSASAVTYGLNKLKGNLVLQLNKWTPDPNESQNSLVAILAFNGAGTVKGSFTGRDNGMLQTGTLTGTYTVNSDGSGTMSLMTSDGGTPQLSFVLNTVTATTAAKGMQVLQTSGQGDRAFTGAALKQ